MKVTNKSLKNWVDEIAKLTKPDGVVWLDGSDGEYQSLLSQSVTEGQLIKLDEKKHPGCYLHRSNPNDVARSEKTTFICTPNKEDAGPTNHWMEPQEAYKTLNKLFDGIMRGRKMYVIPYLMGPASSNFSKVGIELTDSIYVAINMRIMTRMGDIAIKHLGDSTDFVKGVHSVGTFDPNNKYICHFPQDRTIYSVNSGYGGNALLSKKCFALRIASWIGKNEGWMAEHMLITGIEDPTGKITYIAGAFPSACGKTNLAMLQPPVHYKGYRVWCVGDDITWLRIGDDGQLYAINPEAGFFGVAPGTNNHTNPNMMKTISKNSLFTNVAMTKDKSVWWEGLDLPTSNGMLDWKGQEWTPNNGNKGAHPNARFTAPIKQCPIYSPKWDDPQGVPISAILFGSRMSNQIPLVYESFNWAHGVFMGATLSSEKTAAAEGKTGVIRNDPMAMLPFCGYNMADYFQHWLEMGKKMKHPPKIFGVNWFRKNEKDKFIWPGFGDNLRVLKWIIDRCHGQADATKTPIGLMPTQSDLDTEGLNLTQDDYRTLLSVDRQGWLSLVQNYSEFFDKFGSRLPQKLQEERENLLQRLKE